jgi:hypothetical protein
MKRRFWLTILLVLVGLAAIVLFKRLMIRESGHGFPIDDQIVLCEYGYSRGGDVLHWAIIRTWPKDSTTEQRMADTRVGRSFFVWPLIRDDRGRMIPVGTDGNVYFFEGDKLKTMRVRMNEHTDTMPLDDSQTLEELWVYLQRFRVADAR